MNAIGNGPAFDSLDAIQRWAFERLLQSDLRSAPRGLPTHELLGQTFSLTHPRARTILSPARRWRLPLAVGEFCWHAAASDEVDALAYYAPRWRSFAEDGETIRGSCYGQRIFGRGVNGRSRWDALLGLLRDDPASRRAVIDLSGGNGCDAGAVDVSCMSTMQALVRNGLLHLIVQMRSNDAVWGLPYDVFLFTMIQELLARTLGVELGTYVHGAGSLHLYERHLDLARRVLRETPPERHEMPVMQPIDALPDFLAAEQAIRLGSRSPALPAYWDALATPLRDFAGSSHRPLLTAPG